MATRLRSELRFANGTQGFPCLIEHCKPLDSSLAEAIVKPQLTVTSYWGSRPDLNLLHALQAATGGGPTFRVVPEPGNDGAFNKEHEEAIAANRALVVRVTDARSMYLVPIQSIVGPGDMTPVYWGYVTAPKVPLCAVELLDKHQLALILDLDETLLVANTVNSIDNRILQCEKARTLVLEQHIKVEQDVNLSVEDRERIVSSLVANRNALERERRLLSTDKELLVQFAEYSQIRLNGSVYSPRFETVPLEDGSSVLRPVIRLSLPMQAGQHNHVVLTRIDPNNKGTSMIIRIRPYWEDLRRYLAGEQDGKQRFSVYVCTAAERAYALEAWRLLDMPQPTASPSPAAVNNLLIPLNKRRERIVTVNTKEVPKTLLYTLGLADAEYAEQTADAVAPLPLAVVVDDRTEVWTAPDRPSILQVLPWMYYKDESQYAAGVNLSALPYSRHELLRVRNAIVQMRGEVYQSLDQRVKPTLATYTADGVTETDWQTRMDSLSPPMATVASVMDSPSFRSTFGMPMPNAAVPPPEGTFGPGSATYAMAQPAGSGSSASTAAGSAPPPSIKPQDPRQNRAGSRTTDPRRVPSREFGSAAGAAAVPTSAAGGAGLLPAGGSSSLDPRPSGPPAPAIKNLAAWTLDELEEETSDGVPQTSSQPSQQPALTVQQVLRGEGSPAAVQHVLNSVSEAMAGVLIEIHALVKADSSLAADAVELYRNLPAHFEQGLQNVSAWLRAKGSKGLVGLAQSMKNRTSQGTSSSAEGAAAPGPSGLQQSLGLGAGPSTSSSGAGATSAPTSAPRQGVKRDASVVEDSGGGGDPGDTPPQQPHKRRQHPNAGGGQPEFPGPVMPTHHVPPAGPPHQTFGNLGLSDDAVHYVVAGDVPLDLLLSLLAPPPPPARPPPPALPPPPPPPSYPMHPPPLPRRVQPALPGGAGMLPPTLPAPPPLQSLLGQQSLLSSGPMPPPPPPFPGPPPHPALPLHPPPQVPDLQLLPPDLLGQLGPQQIQELFALAEQLQRLPQEGGKGLPFPPPLGAGGPGGPPPPGAPAAPPPAVPPPAPAPLQLPPAAPPAAMPPPAPVPTEQPPPQQGTQGTAPAPPVQPGPLSGMEGVQVLQALIDAFGLQPQQLQAPGAIDEFVRQLEATLPRDQFEQLDALAKAMQPPPQPSQPPPQVTQPPPASSTPPPAGPGPPSPQVPQPSQPPQPPQAPAPPASQSSFAKRKRGRWGPPIPEEEAAGAALQSADAPTPGSAGGGAWPPSSGSAPPSAPFPPPAGHAQPPQFMLAPALPSAPHAPPLTGVVGAPHAQLVPPPRPPPPPGLPLPPPQHAQQPPGGTGQGSRVAGDAHTGAGAQGAQGGLNWANMSPHELWFRTANRAIDVLHKTAMAQQVSLVFQDVRGHHAQTGQGHSTVTVMWGGRQLVSAALPTKQDAKRLAASMACDMLGLDVFTNPTSHAPLVPLTVPAPPGGPDGERASRRLAGRTKERYRRVDLHKANMYMGCQITQHYKGHVLRAVGHGDRKDVAEKAAMSHLLALINVFNTSGPGASPLIQPRPNSAAPRAAGGLERDGEGGEDAGAMSDASREEEPESEVAGAQQASTPLGDAPGGGLPSHLQHPPGPALSAPRGFTPSGPPPPAGGVEPSGAVPPRPPPPVGAPRGVAPPRPPPGAPPPAPPPAPPGAAAEHAAGGAASKAAGGKAPPHGPSPAAGSMPLVGDGVLESMLSLGVLSQMEYATLLSLFHTCRLVGGAEGSGDTSEAKDAAVRHYLQHVRHAIPREPNAIRTAMKEYLQAQGLLPVIPAPPAGPPPPQTSQTSNGGMRIVINPVVLGGRPQRPVHAVAAPRPPLGPPPLGTAAAEIAAVGAAAAAPPPAAHGGVVPLPRPPGGPPPAGPRPPPPRPPPGQPPPSGVPGPHPPAGPPPGPHPPPGQPPTPATQQATGPGGMHLPPGMVLGPGGVPMPGAPPGAPQTPYPAGMQPGMPGMPTPGMTGMPGPGMMSMAPGVQGMPAAPGMMGMVPGTMFVSPEAMLEARVQAEVAARMQMLQQQMQAGQQAVNQAAWQHAPQQTSGKQGGGKGKGKGVQSGAGGAAGVGKRAPLHAHAVNVRRHSNEDGSGSGEEGKGGRRGDRGEDAQRRRDRDRDWNRVRQQQRHGGNGGPGGKGGDSGGSDSEPSRGKDRGRSRSRSRDRDRSRDRHHARGTGAEGGHQGGARGGRGGAVHAAKQRQQEALSRFGQEFAAFKKGQSGGGAGDGGQQAWVTWQKRYVKMMERLGYDMSSLSGMSVAEMMAAMGEGGGTGGAGGHEEEEGAEEGYAYDPKAWARQWQQYSGYGDDEAGGEEEEAEEEEETGEGELGAVRPRASHRAGDGKDAAGMGPDQEGGGGEAGPGASGLGAVPVARAGSAASAPQPVGAADDEDSEEGELREEGEMSE